MPGSSERTDAWNAESAFSSIEQLCKRGSSSVNGARSGDAHGGGAGPSRTLRSPSDAHAHASATDATVEIHDARRAAADVRGFTTAD
jgi:hypothetical protein